KELAAAHKRQAQHWAKAERNDKAMHHWNMVLRWVKDDVDAQKALDHRDLGGITGTDLEQKLYERSKMIEQAVAEQGRIDYPVEAVQVQEPVLERAQVKYVSFRSEHFLLHGDPGEEDNLQRALVWAERARRVCEAAFPWSADVRGKMAYFVAKDTYVQILRAHADQVPNVEWRIE